MIIGQIKNGIKRLIEWRFRSEDMQDLATWRQNLICQITTAGTREAQERMIKAVRDIDRILN